MNEMQETKGMYAAPAAEPDLWLYRMVIGSLGLAVLLTVILAAVLAVAGRDLPQGVLAIGATCAGALGGLLAPSPVKQ